MWRGPCCTKFKHIQTVASGACDRREQRGGQRETHGCKSLQIGLPRARARSTYRATPRSRARATSHQGVQRGVQMNDNC
eukprot:441600-Amphidinium_carterae.2